MVLAGFAARRAPARASSAHPPRQLSLLVSVPAPRPHLLLAAGGDAAASGFLRLKRRHLRSAPGRWRLVAIHRPHPGVRAAQQRASKDEKSPRVGTLRASRLRFAEHLSMRGVGCRPCRIRHCVQAPTSVVIAGLDPAIPFRDRGDCQQCGGVDARIKSGHDDISEMLQPLTRPLRGHPLPMGEGLSSVSPRIPTPLRRARRGPRRGSPWSGSSRCAQCRPGI